MHAATKPATLTFSARRLHVTVEFVRSSSNKVSRWYERADAYGNTEAVVTSLNIQLWLFIGWT